MSCPKCGKPMPRANELTQEHEMASNPWFVEENAKRNEVTTNKRCA